MNGRALVISSWHTDKMMPTGTVLTVTMAQVIFEDGSTQLREFSRNTIGGYTIVPPVMELA